jgi:collagenase-like PrtC family protease
VDTLSSYFETNQLKISGETKKFESFASVLSTFRYKVKSAQLDNEKKE